MKTNKYKNVPIVKLRLLYSQHNSPERDEIMDEMGRQELSLKAKTTWSFYMQLAILILTITMLVFTVSPFLKQKFPFIDRVTGCFFSKLTNSSKANKQSNENEPNNKKDTKDDIHKNNLL